MFKIKSLAVEFEPGLGHSIFMALFAIALISILIYGGLRTYHENTIKAQGKADAAQLGNSRTCAQSSASAHK